MASEATQTVTVDPELSKEIKKLKSTLEFTHQWYAVRWKRLRDLIHDDARHIEDDACCIMANGTADSMEPPDYDRMLVQKDNEIMRLKKFEQAMQRMAAQYVHPKTTAEEMVESILKAKTL